MRKHSILFFLALSIAVFSVGCSPKWKVLKKANNPNPFHKQILFAIGSAYYTSLTVNDMPEDAHTQKLNAEEKKQWKSDKGFFSRDFGKSLKEHASGLRMAARVVPKAFLLKPHVTHIKMGNGKDSLKVKFRLRIEKKSSLYDLVEMTVEVKASEAPTFSRRFRIAARRAGKLVAEYVKTRAK